MNIKSILSVTSCIVIGFMMSNFMFKQYDILKASSSNMVYFLQIGSYTSKKEMEEANISSSRYIVEENDGIYYAYIALTTDKENFEKLKNYFKNKKYDITLKEKVLANEKFNNILEKYDLLLKETSDEATIKLINDQIIDKYKELVIGG